MSYGLRVTEPPVGDVLTLREIKAQINQADAVTRDDLLLMRLAKRAAEDIEQWTNRALLTQTVQFTMDWQPPAVMLPRNPVQRVKRYEYLDSAAVWQEFDQVKYALHNDREPAIIELNPGQQWPSSTASRRGKVRITYVAGFGDDASAIPETLLGCILRLTETYYRFRGADEMPDGLAWAIESWSVPDEFANYSRGAYSVA